MLPTREYITWVSPYLGNTSTTIEATNGTTSYTTAVTKVTTDSTKATTALRDTPATTLFPQFEENVTTIELYANTDGTSRSPSTLSTKIISDPATTQSYKSTKETTTEETIEANTEDNLDDGHTTETITLEDKNDYITEKDTESSSTEYEYFEVDTTNSITIASNDSTDDDTDILTTESSSSAHTIVSYITKTSATKPSTTQPSTTTRTTQPSTTTATTQPPTTTTTTQPLTTTSTTKQPPTTTSTTTQPPTTTTVTTQPPTTTTTKQPPTTTTITTQPPTTTTTTRPPTTTTVTTQPPTTTTVTTQPPTTTTVTTQPPTTTTTTQPPTTTTVTTQPPTTTTVTTQPPTTTIVTTQPPTTISTTSQPQITNTSTTMHQTTSSSYSILTTKKASEICKVQPEKENHTICNTIACRNIAADMLVSKDLDEKADPCSDFYKYACAGVIDKHYHHHGNPYNEAQHVMQDALLQVSPHDVVMGPVRVFYDSCLTHATTVNATFPLMFAKTLLKSLDLVADEESIPTEPVTETYVPTTTYNLTKTLADLMKVHFAPVFDVLLDVDEHNSSKFVLRITLPEFKSYFTQDLSSQTCLKEYNERVRQHQVKKNIILLDQEYEEYINCVRVGQGLNAWLNQMKTAMIKMNLMEHIGNHETKNRTYHEIETEINLMFSDLNPNLPSPPEMKRTIISKNYTNCTLQQLDEKDILGDQIQWRVLVNELLGLDVNGNEEVHVYFMDQVSERIDQFSSIIQNQQLNLLMMMIAERVYSDLVQPLISESRAHYCLTLTSHLMPDMTAAIYLKNVEMEGSLLNLQLRNKAMVINIKQAQLNRTEGISDDQQWMNKLDSMNHYLVEDLNSLVDNKTLLDNMRQYPMVTDNFLHNSVTLLRRYRHLLYKMYSLSPHSTPALWSQFMFPYGTSLYDLNKIILPIGDMIAPFDYGPEVPDYVNYAGIGHVIAQEMMHIFYTVGMKNNPSTINQLQTSANLIGASECLADQLENSEWEISSRSVTTKFKVNKTLVLDKALADTDATRIAWDAYRSSVSQQQHQFKTTTPASDNESINTVSDYESDISVDSRGGSSRRRRQMEQTTRTSNVKPLGNRLPWLQLTPQQIFYLRIAQVQCQHTSELDMLKVMERGHLPAAIRVNLMMRNEELFAEAFNCKVGNMVKPIDCS